MKKLMTMIAAVGMAFGLFADAPSWPAGTSFDTAKGEGISDITLSEGFTETEFAPGEAPDVAARNNVFVGKANANYGAIKTTLGNPVTASAVAVELGGAFFDSFVNLTAFDEDPNFEAYTDAKIAVYLQEMTNGNEQVESTNLFVRAYNPATGAVENFDCGEANDLAGWKRLTIKAIGNITTDDVNPVPGFVVFIDKSPKNSLAAKTICAGLDLTPVAAEYATDGKLFPSMVQSGAAKLTISEVAFDGQGGVDDLLLTKVVPFTEAADPAVAVMTWDADKVSAVQYSTDDGATWTDVKNVSDGSEKFVDNIPVGAIKVKWTGKDIYTDGKNDSFTLEANKSVAITDSYTEGDATFDNGTTVKAYALADAIAEAEKAQTGTIKLLKPVDGFTFNNAIENSEIVLDLNGQTVAGKAGDSAAIYVESGALIIEGTGVVDGTLSTGEGEDATAIDYDAGTVTIVGGNYIGGVYATITGGKFTDDPSDYVDPTLYDVVEISEDPYFYEVVDHVAKPGKVIFLAGDKTFSTPIDPQTADEDGKVTQPAAQDDLTGDYRVIGWIDEDGDSFDFANDTIPVDTTVELTAVWGKYFAKIGDNKYATLADAVDAAVDGNTIELTDNSEGAGFAGPKGKFPNGLTIDLKSYTFTFSGGPKGSAATDACDGFNIQTGNVVTVKNGKLAVAAETTTGELRDIVRIYGHTDNTTVTFEDVVFDAANMKDKAANKYSDVIRIEGGNVNFTGTTAISGNAAYAVKFGNHASADQYKCGTLKFDTTGDIKGKVILMGGAFQEVAVGSGSEIEYHYGNNASSTYVDGMATDGNGAQLFAARIGVLDYELDLTKNSETNDVGVLYKALAAAKTAAGTTDTLTLIKPITLTENTKFDCVVAVASNDFVDARIALATFSFTENGGALTSDDFTTEIEKKNNGDGTFTYTVKSVGPTPIDPSKGDVQIAVPAGIDTKEAAEAWAQENVTVKSPDTEVISDTDYKAYFKFTAITEDAPFVVEATLKDDIVKAEAETEDVLEEVLKLTAGGAIEITSAKPGLYYSLKQGEAVNNRAEGTRVLAESTTVELNAQKWTNSGFYQVLVNTQPAD